MLIKKADDQSKVIEQLEQQARGPGPTAKQAQDELRRRKAGIKGETESAYLIDFHFGHSPNWAVIHDLRLEHKGRVAQIDHLLINRWMDIYVLESKHFHAGFKVTNDGEFLRWNDFRKTYEGMPSPIEQNERHIDVLRELIDKLDWPTRLGLRIAPSFQSLILVAPNARIDRPKGFDTSRVIKADQLKARVWRDIDDENPLLGLLKTAAKIVSRDTVEFVARKLITHHRSAAVAPPAPPAPPQSNPVFKAPATAAPSSRMDGPACKACGERLGEILYGKYGYYFKCQTCDANTNIRFTCMPDHRPRLRKEGIAFYRECAACGTSDLFYRNPK